jgi:hypothetical protein
MRPTASGYGRISESDEETLRIVVQAEMAENIADLRVEQPDGFASIGTAFQSYDRLGWNPFKIDATNGKPASVNTPADQLALVVRANGLFIFSCAANMLPSVLAKPGFSKCPVFANADGSNPKLIFKSRVGTLEGTLDGFKVQSWGELIPGFESMQRFLRLPPEQSEDGHTLVWLKPPGRKSLLPSLPWDAALRIEDHSHNES